MLFPKSSMKNNRFPIYMAVPDYIRKVPRPVNTIVEDNGRDGPNRYAVRERVSTRYIPGGNPQPRNGKVIGHIHDGRFVPKQAPSSISGPDMLSYGASAFVKSVSGDLLTDLMDVYPVKEAYTIMAAATLRTIKPSIVNGRLSSEYNRTFVCRDYPGIGMSANTISGFLQRLGQDGTKRRLFYQKCAMRVALDHHVAVDGMLRQDTSTVNALSAFSYKARTKGCRDVSVIYAYDIEAMEPICAEVFPGDSIDAVFYRSFILDNDIKKGIIIADKGFPPVRIIQELGDCPDLHFLTPIKRNDSRIGNNNMLALVYLKNLRPLDYPSRFPDRKQRNVAGQRKKQQSKSQSVREDVQGRIPDLPVLYSTADWETFN